MAKNDNTMRVEDYVANRKDAIAVPSYGGPQVSPAVGAGTQGARFNAMTAPKAPGIFDGVSEGVNKWAAYEAKLLDENDEAIANDIARRVRDHAILQRTDKTIGYMNLKGADATSVDQEGKNLADRTIESLEAFANDQIEERKLTPRQRAKLMPQLNAIYNNQYGHAMGHILEQNQAFIKESLDADRKSFVNQAAAGYDSPEDIENALKNLEVVAGKQCDRDGVTGNAREMRIREAKGEAIYGAVIGAIAAAQTDDSKIYYAEGLLREYRRYLTAAQAEKLLTHINDKKDYVDTKRGGEMVANNLGIPRGSVYYRLPFGSRFYGNQGNISKPDAIAQATDFMRVTVSIESGGKHFVTDEKGKQTVVVGRHADGTMPPPEKRAFGVAQVTKGAAEWVYRNMDGNKKPFTKEDWEKVVNDPEENRRVGSMYLAGMLMKFGSMDKAVAAYNCGPGNVEKAIKAGGENNWRAHLPAETRNYLVKAEKKLSSIATPKDVKNADGTTMSALDPQYAAQSWQGFDRDQAKQYVLDNFPRARVNIKYRDAMIDSAMAEQERSKQAFSTGQTNAINRCYDSFLTKGRDGLDLVAFRALTPRAQAEFEAWMKRKEAGDNTGDYRLAARIAADPERYFKLPDESWNTYKNLLSDKDWKHLDASRIAWQSKSELAYNGDRALKARAEAGDIDYSFSSVGSSAAFEAVKKIFPDLKDLDGQGQEGLGFEVMKYLAEWGMNAKKKITAGSPEMSLALHDAISKEFTVEGIMFDSKKNIFNVDFSKELKSGGPTAPYDILKLITQRVKGKDNVTTNEMNETALSMFLRRGNPVGNLDIPMDKVAEEYITQEYVDAWKKDHGADPRPDQMPTKLDIIKTYLKYSIMGRKIPADWLNKQAAARAAGEAKTVDFESE